MRKHLLPALPALLAALVLVGPALFGKRDFRPVDLRAWPPWSLELTPRGIRESRAASDLDAPEKTFLALPELLLARKEIARGRAPLWNPFNRTGGPLLSHSLEGLLYPPHWILFLLPPGKAFALLALLSFLLAALFTYLLLRTWKIPKTAALGGALFFAFSAQMAANAHFYMRQDTLALLPGVFWAFEAWRAGGKKSRLVWMALLLGGVWTAGFPPFAYAITAALGAWVLLAAGGTWREAGRREAIRVLGGAGFALFSGLLLAAPQVAPLLSYLPWSERTLPALGGDPRSWGADPAVLLTWAVPDLFGAPYTSARVPYLQSPLTWLLFLWSRPGTGLVTRFNFTENVLYLGALPLLLALWGISRPWRGKRGPLLALLAAFLVLALGLEGGLLSGILPGLRRACPSRLLPAAVFLAALFSARGLALFLGGHRPPRWIVLAGILLPAALALSWYLVHRMEEPAWKSWILRVLASRYRGPSGRIYTPAEIESLFLHGSILAAARKNLLSALAGALPWWALAGGTTALARTLRGRPPAWAGGALVLLGLLDLLHLALPLCPSFPSLDPFSGTPFHETLARERKRLAPSGGVTLARVGPAGTEPGLFPADLPTALGVRDLQAYAFVDRATHRPMERAWKVLSPGSPSILFRNGPWIGNLPDSALLEHPVLDLYGVTHLLARRPPAHGSYRVLLEEKGPGGSLCLLERKPRPPRARVVPRAVPLEDEKALERMASPHFRPDEIAFLPPGTRGIRGRGGGKVVFLDDTPGRVLLDVRDTGGGLLLLSDTWAPCWGARLDGKEVPLLRADTCFRGVALPPGNHHVEFLLSKGAFHLGLLLFAAGALLLAGLSTAGKGFLSRPGKGGRA